MKIIIAGGTGFIGQALVNHFLQQQIHCVVIGRSVGKIEKIFNQKVKAIMWQAMGAEGLHEIKTADAVINLTGADIGEHRWNEKRKIEIMQSRIEPTRTLTELCATLGKNSPPLLNAGGVGIYGLQKSEANKLPPPLDERSKIDCENPQIFLTKVGCAWEAATQVAKNAGARVVNMRFGVVLGKNGGVLSKLKKIYLLGLGGPIGSGQQPFSWVALADLIRAVEFLLQNTEINGPVNIVAPQCVTQKQFAVALGKALHRPVLLKTPAFLLESLFGQMARELLLQGQHVKPFVLEQAGFKFLYPEINLALNSIFS